MTQDAYCVGILLPQATEYELGQEGTEPHDAARGVQEEGGGLGLDAAGVQVTEAADVAVSSVLSGRYVYPIGVNLRKCLHSGEPFSRCAVIGTVLLYTFCSDRTYAFPLDKGDLGG